MLKLDQDGQPLFDSHREEAIKEAFFDAVCLMRHLRERCPWDAKQTPESLKRYVIEEAYEVVDAIDEQDWQELEKELGDFVFQVLFQAQIQEEKGRFQIETVITALIEKMVRRHPHVFADQQGIGIDQIWKNWHDIKRQEKGEQSSLFAGFPNALPALQAAYKIGKKTESVAFDWQDAHQVMLKVREEMQEMEAELEIGNEEHLKEEMGDLLFTLSQLCRKLNIEPEETLRQANQKFLRRFEAMELLAKQRHLEFSKLASEAKEDLWQEIKSQEL